VVYLVGAGPGRPDLITLRGAACLARADAVVLDALADRRLLAHAKPAVRVIDAGKRGRGRVIMRQPRINALLVRLARAGKTVVRLKGGDPCFFGRGGEEADFLRAHGIPFEIVPGVSSIAAVPAYAGIPLTHRGLSSTVTVVTGHEGRENPYLRETLRDVRRRGTPGVNWETIPKDGTLVILMGVGRLEDIVRRLSRAGWPAATPVAAVQWGTLPAQKTVQGVLGDIARRVRRSGLGPPAVVVAGRVVSLRKRLAWFERLPLFGRRVLVTRPAAETAGSSGGAGATQSSQMASLLEGRGARALECPVIEIKPLPLGAAGRARLKNMASYDGVLFTSANAARIFLRLWKRRSWPARASVYAVGPKTAAALSAGGLAVRATAPEYVAESLAGLLNPAPGRRFLLPRAESARDALPDALRAGGAVVDVWPLYRTVARPLPPDIRRRLLAGEIDAVTFTSTSTVSSLMAGPPRRRIRSLFRRTAAASIGPITTRALRAFGVEPRVHARPSTMEGLAEALDAYFRGKK
jgi:uroporphyrinogen III methyltransferase / synthase